MFFWAKNASWFLSCCCFVFLSLCLLCVCFILAKLCVRVYESVRVSSIDITTQFILLSIRYDTKHALTIHNACIHNLYICTNVFIWYGVLRRIYAAMEWIQMLIVWNVALKKLLSRVRKRITNIHTYYINKHNNRTENQKHHRTPYTHIRSQFLYIFIRTPKMWTECQNKSTTIFSARVDLLIYIRVRANL